MMIKMRLVRLLSHGKKYIVYNVLWQWIALLTQVGVVFAIAGLLESILDGTVDERELIGTAIVLLVSVVVRFVCDRMAERASYYAGADVKRILRQQIYEKLLRLGASYKDRTATSEIVQLSTEGVEQLEIYFSKYLPQLFYSLLAPVTLFVLLSTVCLKAVVVLLICVPLIPVSIVAVQKFAKKLLNKYWGIYTELGDSFLENLQGLTTLKIYQADKKKAEEMDEESQRFRRITMKVLTMQLNSTSVMDIIAYGGAAVGMIVVVKEFLQGNVGFAGTLSIILLASEFFIPLRLLGSFFHIAMNGMAASDKIFRLLDLEEPQKASGKLPEGPLDIELRQVHFSYEEDREILKGIDLRIPAGSFVSLVGESGCGKSTIAGLLAGRNSYDTGEITIGGMNLREVSEGELMSHVTLIRHNSYLFKGTVRENLQMAGEAITDKQMVDALEKVNLRSFMEEQEGLDTKLAERGSNLSGGQCQRLALARGILHDTPVYIFDEATSNIDADSEELIMDVIRELAKTKSILLISHRLANVVESDCIYFLMDGTIGEQGTQSQLMEQNGNYKRLYERQKQLEQFGGERDE